jgi:phenylpropionate dioxygenase-like ring-hydroxylating dioxygenase large terminal subunit
MSVAGLDTTLSAAWYTDPAHFELEQRAIFRRSWQLVAVTGDLAAPGDYVTSYVGTTSVIVIRDNDGVIHTFANVCRHRGAEILAPGRGCTKSLQCPYHAWTYSLDGTLRGVPRGNVNSGFSAEGISLLELRTERLGGLVFATLDDDAEPLETVLGPWLERIAQEGITLPEELKTHSSFELPVHSNWKLNIENGFECYHCPTVHPSLGERRGKKGIPDFSYQLDWDDFVVHGFNDDTDRLGRYGFSGRPRMSFLFPNAFPTLFAGGFGTVLQVRPIDAEHSVYYRAYWVTPGDDEARANASAQEYADFLNVLDAEDVDITESVQRGQRTAPFEEGILMLPETDAGIQWFQQQIRRRVTAFERQAG